MTPECPGPKKHMRSLLKLHVQIYTLSYTVRKPSAQRKSPEGSCAETMLNEVGALQNCGHSSCVRGQHVYI